MDWGDEVCARMIEWRRCAYKPNLHGIESAHVHFHPILWSYITVHCNLKDVFDFMFKIGILNLNERICVVEVSNNSVRFIS